MHQMCDVATKSSCNLLVLSAIRANGLRQIRSLRGRLAQLRVSMRKVRMGQDDQKLFSKRLVLDQKLVDRLPRKFVQGSNDAVFKLFRSGLIGADFVKDDRKGRECSLGFPSFRTGPCKYTKICKKEVLVFYKKSSGDPRED